MPSTSSHKFDALPIIPAYTEALPDHPYPSSALDPHDAYNAWQAQKMNGHQQTRNSTSTFNQHSFSQSLPTRSDLTESVRTETPHVTISKSEYEGSDLADQEAALNDPDFFTFLHGTVATTRSATRSNMYSQRVPHTQQTAKGMHTYTQHLGNQHQSTSGNSVQQFPFAVKHFMPFSNQNEALLPESMTSTGTYDTMSGSTQDCMSQLALQDQNPTSKYRSYLSDEYSILPDLTSSYFTSPPYPAPATNRRRGSLSPSLRTATLSITDAEPVNSRPPTKRRREEASPDSDSGTYGTANTRLGDKSTTRAAKYSTKIKQPRSKRALLSHSYDPYLGHFNSWVEAKEELFGVKWTPPTTADIPMTDMQKIPFVMQVYNAMTDFSEFYDKQGAKGDNRMLRQKAYDSRYIEARSWEVVVSTQTLLSSTRSLCNATEIRLRPPLNVLKVPCMHRFHCGKRLPQDQSGLEVFKQVRCATASDLTTSITIY
jgi:hypothetical protein